MATGSGKIYQIKDGSGTQADPYVNIFPRTVTSAVYGLDTAITTAISAFQQTLGSMAYEAATDYLPLTGGTLTTAAANVLTINNSGTGGSYIRCQVGGSNKANIGFDGTTGAYMQNRAVSGTPYVNIASDGVFKYNNTNPFYHSGNFRAGTEYVSISGAETISGKKTFTGAVFSIQYDNPRIGFYTAAGTLNGVLGYRDTVGPEIYTGSGWYRMYHSGNSNKSNVNWTCANLSANGTITSTGDQVISSDINFKENLQDVKYSIADIAKCRAVTFDWKDGRGKSAGSIAQDWKPLIPELVHGEEGDMTLAYGQIAMINSILLARHETEQDKEIARLKARVKELETRLNIS